MSDPVPLQTDGEVDFLTLSPDYVFEVGTFYTDWGAIKPVLDSHNLDYTLDNVAAIISIAILRRALPSRREVVDTPSPSLQPRPASPSSS